MCGCKNFCGKSKCQCVVAVAVGAITFELVGTGHKLTALNLSVDGKAFEWEFSLTSEKGSYVGLAELPILNADTFIYARDINSRKCQVKLWLNVVESTAIIEPCANPTITTQPTASSTIAVNGIISLSVVASGSNLSYQWRKLVGTDWVDIDNATGASLQISPAQTNDTGVYAVHITNTCDNGIGYVLSNISAVTVNGTGSGGGTGFGYGFDIYLDGGEADPVIVDYTNAFGVVTSIQVLPGQHVQICQQTNNINDAVVQGTPVSNLSNMVIGGIGNCS